MRTASNAPILIVGGGPVGLFTAWLLARHGLASTIVERYPSHLRAPKAHVLNPRTLEIFRASGIDVDHLRTLGPRREDSGFVRFAESLAGREYGSVPYERQDPDVLADTPTPLMNLPQPVLEEYLEGLVKANPLVTLLREHMWKGAERGDEIWRSTVEAEGADLVFESRYVLACDGAASPVREFLGIAMEGAAGVQTCLTVHFRANLRPIVKDRPAIIYQVVNREASGAFVAHDIDSNWIFIHFLPPGEALERLPSHDEAGAMVRAAIGAEVDLEVLRLAPWTMTAEVARSYRSGNLFLVGDAAHRFPPNGGLGMNTGLQDAHNLAWKIAAVEEGWAGAQLLDSYESERRGIAIANSEQSLANAMTGPRLVMTLVEASAYIGQDLPAEMASRVAEAIRANAVTFDNHGLHLGFSYDAAHALPPAPHIYAPRALPGDRLPHAWLGDPRAGQSVLDMLRGDGFTLLTIRDDAAFRERATAIFAPIPIAVVAVGNAADTWLELTGLADARLMLVRPDGHILASAAGTDGAALEQLAAAADEFCGLQAVSA